MDDLERAGVGVVDADLFGREGVLDQFVFDAVVGKRAGGVEAQRLEVPRQNLHGRHPAGLDGGDELRPGREREVRPAPETKALGVGEVAHRGRAGGRDIEHARVRQGVLEAQAGAALLRGGLVAAWTGGAGGVLHGVALVEDDDSVEVAAEPIDDLAHPRNLVRLLVGAQRGVGGK